MMIYLSTGVAYNNSMSRAFRVEMCICNGQGRIIFPTGLSVHWPLTGSMGMLAELMSNETERSTDRQRQPFCTAQQRVPTTTNGQHVHIH